MDFEKWLPVMEDPSKYWGTPPINLIWALKQSLEIIKSRDQERYARHLRHAALLMRPFLQWDFRYWPTRGIELQRCRFTYIGEFNIDDSKFRSLVAEEGAYIAGCLGIMQERDSGWGIWATSINTY